MEQIQDLETAADEAARMNAEVEVLREEVSRKAADANRKLDEVKNRMMNAKRQIKASFDPMKWMELGVMDKRWRMISKGLSNDVDSPLLFVKRT